MIFDNQISEIPDNIKGIWLIFEYLEIWDNPIKKEYRLKSVTWKILNLWGDFDWWLFNRSW